MEQLVLNVTTRESTDSVNSLRKSGSVPAVVYGNKKTATSLALPLNEFEKIYRKAGESTLVTLNFPDGVTKNVLIHDISRHPVSYQIDHIDFLEINLEKTLVAPVSLEFTGEAPAVKALGGTLVKLLDEIEVECLPKDLPHNIEVDISVLENFETFLKVGDIRLPDKVKLKTDPTELVAKVQAPRNVEAEMNKEVGDVSAVEGIKEAPPEESTTEPS